MSLLYNNKESLGDIIMYLHILMKIGNFTQSDIYTNIIEDMLKIPDDIYSNFFQDCY